MSNPNEEICEIMSTYSESIELRISLIINWIILIPAFPIITYALFYSLKQRLLHQNAQLQVTIHLVALLIHCFGRFVLHSADLSNYFLPHSSACQILPNFYRCLIFRFFYNFGQALVSMTPVSITLERFIAVRYNSGYENCPFGYGLALGLLQIILTFIYLFTRYIHAAFSPNNFTFFYCQTLVSSTMTTAQVVIPLYLTVAAQIISIVSFRILEKRNHRLRAISDMNLSTKFTLDQGKRSFAALKAFIHYNCVMVSTMTLGISVLHFLSSQFTKPRYMAIIELTHAIPLYGIIVCVGVWWRLRVLDGEQRRNLTLAMRGRAVHTEIYFQMFDRQMKI